MNIQRARRIAAFWVGFASVALLLVACMSSSGGSGGGGSSGSGGAGPFSLTFVGKSYSGNHAGQTMKIALVNATTNAVVMTNTLTVPSSGDLTSTFTGQMVQRGLYRVDWYVDYNGSGQCDAFATDHEWSVPVTDSNGDGTGDGKDDGTTSAAAVDNDVTLTHTHDLTFTNVCASFPAPAPVTYSLTFVGKSYSGFHGGATMKIALVNAATNAVVQTNTLTVPSSGDTTSVFTGQMAQGGLYRLDWYVDVNANAQCDAPGVDHEWRVPVTDPNGDGTNDGTDDGSTSPTAVNYDVTLTQTHNLFFTNVCASFP